MPPVVAADLRQRRPRRLWGDLHHIDTIREAMEGIDAAYLVYPVQPGLLDATVNFTQGAREAGVSAVLNLSQRSANRNSKSNPCRDTFIAEQVLNWSGLAVTGVLFHRYEFSHIPKFRRTPQ